MSYYLVLSSYLLFIYVILLHLRSLGIFACIVLGERLNLEARYGSGTPLPVHMSVMSFSGIIFILQLAESARSAARSTHISYLMQIFSVFGPNQNRRFCKCGSYFDVSFVSVDHYKIWVS